MDEIIDNAKYILDVLKKLKGRKVTEVDLTYAITMCDALKSSLESEKNKIKEQENV